MHMLNYLVEGQICNFFGRVLAWYVESPEFNPQHGTNWVWCGPVISVLGRQRQEAQKLNTLAFATYIHCLKKIFYLVQLKANDIQISKAGVRHQFILLKCPGSSQCSESPCP